MKIGINTPGIDRWGDRHYQMLREAGFDTVDFSQLERHPSRTPKDHEQFLLNERKLADEAGVEIRQTHGPWRWPPLDDTPERRAERFDTMSKTIYYSGVLGCKNWVIHPIMPFGTDEIGTGMEQATWDMNIEFMSRLLEVAKSNGVTICLENMPMPQFSLAAPLKVLEFVKTINDPDFKICLDTGHAAVIPGANLADDVRALGDELRVLHVHDNDGRADRHWIPYKGIIDWAGFSKALHDINYQGSVSLELGYMGMSLPAAEAYYAALAEIAKTIAQD